MIRGKIPRWMIIILGLVISCSVTCGATYIVLYTDFGCFGVLIPSPHRIEEVTNLRIPETASAVEWRCKRYFDANRIVIRFAIPASDETTITTSSGTYAWKANNPPYEMLKYFDVDSNEIDLEKASTWQTNSRCGWTNIWIDKQDPDRYDVYADYQGWEDCFF